MFGIPEWALGVGFIIIVASVVKAIARSTTDTVVDRMRGRKGARALFGQAIEDMQGRLGGADDLRQRLGEMDEMQRRLSEIEERLDFAERMLTKQREADRLPADKK